MEWWWDIVYNRDWLPWLTKRSERLPSGCIVWTQHHNNRGYPVLYLKSGGRKKALLVHRVAYMVTKGNIPEGMEIDHTCFVSSCWEPAHLEAVTGLVNNQRAWDRRREEECPQGYKFTESNTAYGGRGWRYCKQCNRDRVRAAALRKAVLA